MGEGDVLQAGQGAFLHGVAGPAGDDGEGQSVGKDGEADEAGDDAVADGRVDAEEDDEHGELGDGRGDEVGDGVGQDALVELDKVGRVELGEVPAPTVCHH